MKLLLDHNLSPKLINNLTDIFPESSSVALLGLERALDSEVWNAAREQSYIIVSKDADFNELRTAKGLPPKVVWLRLGNRTATKAEQALRKHRDEIANFDQDNAAGLLEIY